MKTEEKGGMGKIRIAILGQSNVGKSALAVRFLTRRFIGEYRSNTDLLYKQTLVINNSPIEVEVVEVCSGESCFPEEAVQWADGCVIVYDITSSKSLQYAISLIQGVQQLRPQLPLVLLANKSDLEHLRQVEDVEGRAQALQNKCNFYECSVAENTNTIYTAFDHLMAECRCQNVQQNKTRKFSVTKMIGTLMGTNNCQHKQQQHQGGTVVVCHKSDLYKSRILKRRQNFTAAASL